MMKRLALWAAAAMVATALGCGPLVAQPAVPSAGGIKRTLLETHDVPGTKYQSVLAIAEIAPNAKVAPHTHPGIESGYVLQGSLTLSAKGQPTRLLQAGQSFSNPAGVPHWGTAGPEGAKIVSSFVVEKGKPLASPAQ